MIYVAAFRMDAVPQFFYDLEVTRSSDHCFLSNVAIFQLEGFFVNGCFWPIADVLIGKAELEGLIGS
ncbi:hypothetical protein CYL20_01160 [Pseudomonas palleroniana]|uniref:Uncharacterized protein n=1 Tax=Pseudomonas palleroniana TaxID=191390 RepID=A0A2L1J413_9PSED|nr:hypothetical protein CYL20_01160 [Pseudomonas palleroniana]